VSLFSPSRFEAHAGSLKSAIIVRQWGSHVAKVGGKVFALCGDDGASIAFKVSETSFEGLTALAGIAQAPYFAKRAWVSVAKGALGDADLKAYIRASYNMVVKRLTRKVRTELGLMIGGEPVTPAGRRKPSAG